MKRKRIAIIATVATLLVGLVSPPMALVIENAGALLVEHDDCLGLCDRDDAELSEVK